MSGLVPVAEPSSLVAVTDQCATVEAWAEQCMSVPELQDAAHKLAAVDEYLARTSTEGRGRVAATIRRLEERIGQLIGPASPNGKSVGSVATDPDGLTKHQRHEFRMMAAHPDVVAVVVADSTDTEPASRRKVTDAIRAKTKGPVPEKTRDAMAARVAKAEEMAAAGATSRQIGKALGYANVTTFANFRRDRSIEVPADALLGKPRNFDPNRIVEQTVNALEGAAFGLDLVKYEALNPDELEGWVTSLGDSLKSLNSLLRTLKEMTHAQQ